MKAERFSKDLDPNYAPADSSEALTAAIAAHPFLEFKPGLLTFTNPVEVDADGRKLSGASVGSNAFTVYGTEFRFTGTGSGDFLHLDGTRGFESSGVSWRYSSASYTGRLINIDGFSTFVTFTDGFCGSTNPITTRTAEGVFSFESGFTGTLRNINAGGADSLVIGPDIDFYGGADGAENYFWNGLTIDGGYWHSYDVAIVKNPDSAWTLNGLTAQARYNGGGNGVGCAVLCDEDRPGYGLTVNGGWYGDVAASAGDAWFQWRGQALSINGGLFACSSGGIFEALEAVSGTAIHGASAFGNLSPSYIADFTASGANASTNTSIAGNRLPSGGAVYRSGTTPAS